MLQRAVSVAFTLANSNEAAAQVEQVRVEGRVYPSDSKIFGRKSKGDARLHMSAWDLDKLSWENKFTKVPMTVAEVATWLTQKNRVTVPATRVGIEQAYAAYITKKAEQMAVLWGDATENASQGGIYNSAKQEQGTLHRRKHSPGGVLNPTEVSRNKELKRKMWTSSRQLLTKPVKKKLKAEGYDGDAIEEVDHEVTRVHKRTYRNAFPDTSDESD